MNKYDEFLKSIIALGVRFGQENTNKNVEDVTDSAFKALMIAFKGENPIEELKQDETFRARLTITIDNLLKEYEE